MGGADKAMAQFRGESLLQRTLLAMGDSYAETCISYNRATPAQGQGAIYWAPDLRPGFLGPLAGLEALLAHAQTDWLLTLPVDLREVPEGLGGRLLGLALQHQAAAASVIDADGRQPLVAIWNTRAVRPAVKAALDGNRHGVQDLLGSLECVWMDIAPWRLGNLNLLSDLEIR